MKHTPQIFEKTFLAEVFTGSQISKKKTSTNGEITNKHTPITCGLGYSGACHYS